jgi:hypothetical protein
MGSVSTIYKDLTADEILEQAKGKFETVMILGLEAEAMQFMFSNQLTLAEINLLVDQFKLSLLEGEFYYEEDK